jgi:hypothetical protein
MSDSLSNSPQKDLSLSLNDAPSEPVVVSKRSLICKRDNNLPTRSSTPPHQFTPFYRSPTHISSHSNPSSPVSSAILLSLSDNIESRSPYATRTTTDIQQEDFSNEDKFKLRYAMRVYKHIKDENTKINCIQRHFFPNVSLDELKEKLTKYTDNYIHGNNNDSLQTPYQSNPLQSHTLDSPFDSYKDDSQDLFFEDTLLITNNFKTPSISTKNYSPSPIISSPKNFVPNNHPISKLFPS